MKQLALESNSTLSLDECAALLMEVVPLIMRTIRLEMRQRTADLSVPQWRALAYVHRHEGTSLSKLAAYLGLSAPSASKLVDVLVAGGLVHRKGDPADRRRLTLSVTKRGRAVLQAAQEVTRSRLAERLALLSPEERDGLVGALRRLEAAFEPDRPCSSVDQHAAES